MKLLSALTSIALLFNSAQADPLNFVLPASLPNIPLDNLPNLGDLATLPIPPTPSPSTVFPTTKAAHPLDRALNQLKCIGKCANGCESEKQLVQCVMNCHAYCQLFA